MNRHILSIKGRYLGLARRVLYTAMTRARDLLVMVGDKRVLGEMAAAGKKIARYSGLSERLRGEG